MTEWQSEFLQKLTVAAACGGIVYIFRGLIGKELLSKIDNHLNDLLGKARRHIIAITLGTSLATAWALGYGVFLPLLCLLIAAIDRDRMQAEYGGIPWDKERFIGLALALTLATLLGFKVDQSAADFASSLSMNSQGTWLWGPMAAIMTFSCWFLMGLSEMACHLLAITISSRIPRDDEHLVAPQ